MSTGDFGIIYGTATLLSAACLVGVGVMLDKLDLRVMTVLSFSII